MRIRYNWQPEEWREAVLLATSRPRRGTSIPLPYVIVGIMSLGAVGDVVHAIRESGGMRFSGSLAPVLLLAAGVTLGLLLLTRAAARRRHLDAMPAMPQAEQERGVGEDGWQSSAADEATRGTPALRSWSDLAEQRTGKRTLVLVGGTGSFAAVPLRALSDAQGGHLHRLVVRKLRAAR